MTTTKRFLVLLLAGLCGPGLSLCQVDSTLQSKAGLAKESLRWLKTEANPKRDLARALAKGDTSFIGVQGYDVRVPGVENYYKKYSKRYPVHIIPGTGDVYSTSEELELQEKATTYAESYNRRLLKIVKPRKP